MTSTPDASGPEELRAQVEQTRERLGETVEELAAKADVKGRAQHKAAEMKAQVQEKAHVMQEKAAQTGRRNSRLLIAAGAAALAVVVLLRWRSGRRC